MQRRSVAVLLVVVLALVPSVLAAGYSVEPNATTETPTRTISVEGSQFDISAVGRVAYGEKMSVLIDAPDEQYDVYLYNSDRQTVWGPSSDSYGGPYTGSWSISLPTDRLDPGTYAVVVQGPDGQTRAVQPVVVQGYDIDLDAPASLEAGETGNLSVSLTPTGASGDPASVDVAVANGSWDRTIETEKVDGSYEATFSVPSPGEYYVYAAARGTDTAYGRQEPLAITASEPLTVEERTTTTTTTSSDGDGGDAPTTEKTTTTATTTSTTTSTVTTTTSTTTTATTNTTTSTVTTTDAVITPNAGNDTTTTGTPGTPGFTVPVTLLALSLAAVAALRGDRF